MSGLKRFICLLMFTISGLAFAAETEPVPEKTAAMGEPVIVGVPLPLSGSFQEFGMVMQNSFELAKEAINAKGGIKGRPLQLAYGDDHADPAIAEAVVKELVANTEVVMLVGGFKSDSTYPMARVANRLDIPFLICTAAMDKITQQRWQNIYRLSPPVSEYTTGLEDFWLKELRPKTVAIVHENSMFGIGGAASMLAFLERNGIQMQGLIGYSNTRTEPFYFRSLLAELTRDPPDVVYMLSYIPDGVSLAKAVRELHLESQLSGGAAGFAHPDFIKEAGEAANGLVTASLWSSELPYPGAKAYHDQYVARFSAEPDYHGAQAYSGLLVAADALERAASFSPADIRVALNKTYMMTPFGPIKFFTYGNFERQNSVRTHVLQIQEGKFEVIWPLDLATARFIRY